MDKIYVNVEALNAIMDQGGLNDASLAEIMEMDRTTIFKARNGHAVGGKFIANLLKVATGKTFSDLFFLGSALR